MRRIAQLQLRHGQDGRTGRLCQRDRAVRCRIPHGEASRSHRVFVPTPIHFNQAIGVAVIGLLVNLVVRLFSRTPTTTTTETDTEHDATAPPSRRLQSARRLPSCPRRRAHFCDRDCRAAAGKFLGWSWLDPVMGIVGSAVVSVWAYGLVHDTAAFCSTARRSHLTCPTKFAVRWRATAMRSLTDLHVWQVGAGKFAAIVSIVAHDPKARPGLPGLVPRARGACPRHSRSSALSGR